MGGGDPARRRRHLLGAVGLCRRAAAPSRRRREDRGILVGPEPAIAATLTMDELRRAQGEVAAVKVTDDTVDALLAIRDACRGEGITASDRRWKKSLGIVRASAWLAGENKTCPEDLAILVDSLWREPKERSKVARIVGNLADPASMQSVEILDAAREIASKVAGSRPATARSTSRRPRRRSSSSTRSRPSCRSWRSPAAGGPRRCSATRSLRSRACTPRSRARSARGSGCRACGEAHPLRRAAVVAVPAPRGGQRR